MYGACAPIVKRSRVLAHILGRSTSARLASSPGAQAPRRLCTRGSSRIGSMSASSSAKVRRSGRARSACEQWQCLIRTAVARVEAREIVIRDRLVLGKQLDRARGSRSQPPAPPDRRAPLPNRRGAAPHAHARCRERHATPGRRCRRVRGADPPQCMPAPRRSVLCNSRLRRRERGREVCAMGA